MELLEYSRRWRPSRLVIGVVVSLLLHALLIAGLLGVRPSALRKHEARRGETLMVDLRPAEDKAAAGMPGPPQTAPPPKAALPAAPPRAAAKPPTPAPPAPAKPVAKAPPAPNADTAKPAPPAERPPAPAPEQVAVAAPPKSAEPSLPSSANGTLPVPQSAPNAAEPPPAASQARAPEGAPGGGSDAGDRHVASVPPPSGSGQPFVPDIRALRRGSGGAGGRGDARAGIEGEPISLDSKDPKYSDYLDQVRRRIKANWSFPCVKNESTRQCDYKTTDLLVEFGIAKDGHVPFVSVRRSSGYPIYDDYAVNAIKLASPFPRIPDAFSKTGVPISATFSYIVESSLTNLLR